MDSLRPPVSNGLATRSLRHEGILGSSGLSGSSAAGTVVHECEKARRPVEYSAAAVMAELRSARRLLYAAVAFLSLLGLLMVYSASWSRIGAGGSGVRYFLRQLIWLGVGVAAAVAVAHADYRRYVRLKWLALAASMGLLALVLVPGVGASVNGARRWFRFGGIGLQASEFARVGLLVFLAFYTAGRKEVLARFWSGFVPCVSVVAAGSALIVLEPDLGMALLWCALGALLLFTAGARVWHCLFAGALASPALVYLVAFKMRYILERLAAFVRPEAAASGKGYQALQSITALGRGGVFGVHIGRSLIKMYFLPEPHTDFIFAVIGEELGLIGTAAVIAAFMCLVYQGLRIAFWSRDAVGHLLALGATAALGLEACVNIGVVTAMLPTKGMVLPFVSYGGSNMVSSMLLVGLLAAVARRTERDLKELPSTASFAVLPTEVWPAPAVKQA